MTEVPQATAREEAVELMALGFHTTRVALMGSRSATTWGASCAECDWRAESHDQNEVAGWARFHQAEAGLRALLAPRRVKCATCGGTRAERVYEITKSDRTGTVEVKVGSCPDCDDGFVTVPPLLKWNDE